MEAREEVEILDHGIRPKDVQTPNNLDQVAMFELRHMVFDIYGLTHDEVQLLHTTAPPRDPLALVEAMSRPIEQER